MTRRRITIFAVLLSLVLGVIALRSRSLAAAPYVPKDDAEVIERLRAGIGDPRARELTEMRRRLEANPDDRDLAVALAKRNIEEGRARSDPRYLGYAEAALARWWNMDAPPADVLLLRATIRQSTHDFDGALRDLDAVLRLTPDDPQAWLTRSIVLTVRGDYEEAKASCAPLARLTSDLVVRVCFAGVESVTGDAKGAYARLESALKTRRIASPAEEEWAVSTLGEIAVRAGDAAAAERYFDRALALDPSDAYALASWADVVLDQGRAADVATRLASHDSNDGLLLRLALAEDSAKLPGRKAHAAALRARFDASHARGDTVHRREEARFALALEHDARAALTLARANWDVQKEPWDARIFLEAALAAGDANAARPILAWLDRTKLEDPAIARAAARLDPSRAVGGAP